MTDLIGQTLSHYHVTAALGAGGMGKVYRATDTNLDREVAIKVLPPEVAQDPQRLELFRREAQLLASLNHPHIGAIYGLEEADGKPFLALELVEGEELKERLARGLIPVEEALEIAEQIAEALEEAHNKGIVHRDLKPANVKITPEGKAKVLDFGLAKAWVGDAGEDSSPPLLSQSPTVAHGGTVAGMILGTAAYMSPEQARGKSLDKRTDIWSFGVLLWEMLTGRSLFTGATVTDVIAAVVKEKPDLDALPRETPAAVRLLLSRCLRNDPRTRLPDIGAARLELQDLRTGALIGPAAGTATGEALAAERAGRRRERLIWVAAASVAAACAAALAWALLTAAPEPESATRFAIDVPRGWSLALEFSPPQVSPEGRRVLFKAWPEDQEGVSAAAVLWVRPLEALEARPLAGTEGVDGPFFWSPDGRFVAFTVPGELRKLDLAEGTVDRICALPRGADDGQWHENGTIYVSVGGVKAVVYSVSARGGEAKALTRVDAARGEAHHHFVQVLPGGRRFLFTQAGTEELTGLYMAPLDNPEERRRIAPGWRRWLYAEGQLLVVRDGTLLAQPFDVDRGVLTGDPVGLASSVASWTELPDVGWFSASPGGTLAYFSGLNLSDQVQLAWVDRDGRQLETLGAPGRYGQIALAPDERSVALEIPEEEGAYDIWVMDVGRGVTSRVTATPGNERDPVWSADSRSLAFIARREEGDDLRRKGLGVGDPETVLTDSPDEDIPESWSRDGELLFVRRTADDEQSVWALPLDEGGEPRPVLATGFRVDEPQISPDGRWLAYVSPESGREEVYVEPFGGEGNRVRVSVAGGGQPKWRGDGRELFYTEEDGQLMAVEVSTPGDRLEVSLPTELFEIRGLQGMGYDDYAVAADGQRFLVKMQLEESRKQRLHIVTNWTALLD